jgi:23S rRNA (cytidine2498-2'-O)-methyltransferase
VGGGLGEVSLRSSFVFATCQPGGEAFLKEELRVRRPDLRFAFSRPGFATFRATGGDVGLEHALSSPFARLSGLGLGRVTPPETPSGGGSDIDGIAEAAAARVRELGAAHATGPAPPTLHVVARGLDDGGAEADLVASAREALRARLPGWAIDRPLRRGETAICCFPLDAGQWWLGARRLAARERPTADGRPPFAAPEDAPSRVWMKVEEALWLSGLLPMTGDRVLDIGCAPGGGTWALLERGLRVVGVDPGEVDPRIAAHPSFEHIREPFERVDPAALPRDLRWLFFDVSLAPRLVLGHLVTLARALPELRGAVVTIKLANLDALKHLEWVRGRLAAMGMHDPLVSQLFANRQELTAVGPVRR